MIERREEMGLVIVAGVGAFPFGTLLVSRNPRGGLDLFDTARGRYVAVRRPPATFDAADDVSALSRVNKLLEPPVPFKGYAGVPAGSVTGAIQFLADSKQDIYDEDLVALLNSALEDV